MSLSRKLPIALIGMVFAGSAAAAGKPLIVSSTTQARAANDTALESLVASPSTSDIKLVRLNSALVDAGERQLEIELGGNTLTLNQQRSERLESGSVAWYGNVGKSFVKTRSGLDPLSSAILIRSGDTVTGTIRSGGKLYRIRPLASGDHAIIEVNESRMPAEHPDSYDTLPNIRMDGPAGGLVGTAAINPGTTRTIRVLALATNQAVNGYGGNMRSLIELAIAESNQGYANSNVGIRLELASYGTTTYIESGSFSTDLARFRGTSDGYMDSIHATRNSTAADVGMIVLNNSSSCGLASGIGSTASTAFASVYWDCATGYYSFAHEIGHLQSARHDPAADPSTSPYSYGHGYRYGNSWRTIMAYNCSANCPRLNYWSNPDVLYGGVPMGTASASHNQRVLVNTKATVAAFR
jgi:hypothetical protein